MKTMHLHFTVDPTPEVRVRLFPGKPGAFGVALAIGEVESTIFFTTPRERAEWLIGVRAQIDAALEATAVAPDDALPAAQAAI